MTPTQINLTDSQAEALHSLSIRTGKSEDDLLREAVDKFIAELESSVVDREKRLEALRGARGIWKDREDLPDFRRLRAEADRFDRWSEE